MSLEIKIELSEADIEHFRSRFREARENIDTADVQKLVRRARSLLDRGLERDPPDFVRRRLNGLGRIIRMVEDDTWQLPPDDLDRIMQALAYFIDPNDIIADDVAALGLIDDAIAIELALRELRHEIEAYEEFSAYRKAEAQRRANSGKTTDISKQDWLADHRAVLHSRMRERRTQDTQGWRYTTF